MTYNVFSAGTLNPLLNPNLSPVTCTEKFAKFGRVVLRYASGQTDRHTYTLVALLRTAPGAAGSIISDYQTADS